MMHLKNITAGNPKTKEQYQLTKQFNIKWLYSDDGKNWYEEQKNFQPDTLKMVYDHNGVIICIERMFQQLIRKAQASLNYLILQQIAGLIFRVNGCSKMA